MSNDAFESMLIKKKRKKQRTNEDLRKVNNRDSLERTYRQNNSKITKAVAIVGTTAAVLGSLSAIMNNGPKVITNGKAATKKVVNGGKKVIISANIIHNIKKNRL